MLRNLIVDQVDIMDEETCAEMVMGDFGRLLRSSQVWCEQSEVGVLLDMTKARQLAVTERLRLGCNWKDETASLKQLNSIFLAYLMVLSRSTTRLLS